MFVLGQQYLSTFFFLQKCFHFFTKEKKQAYVFYIIYTHLRGAI